MGNPGLTMRAGDVTPGSAKYTAELTVGEQLLTDAHRQDAEQMWVDVHIATIAVNERHSRPGIDAS